MSSLILFCIKKLLFLSKFPPKFGLQKISTVGAVPGKSYAFCKIFTGEIQQNKPKMAYSRDLPKMAGLQCGHYGLS